MNCKKLIVSATLSLTLLAPSVVFGNDLTPTIEMNKLRTSSVGKRLVENQKPEVSQETRFHDKI